MTKEKIILLEAPEEAAKEFDKWLETADVKTRKEVFKTVVDDNLPDGAYFAMAAEFDLEPVDLIDEEDL